MTATYFDAVQTTLSAARDQNDAALNRAARLLADCLKADGVLHAFGTGHGHILAEELFYRAGGLVPVNPILDSGLLLHESALGSTQLERLPGYAAVVLDRYDTRPGDVMLIASNSGRNAAPIEMALLAKARGLNVIALTSLKHSHSQDSRHISGKKLFELADIVLDNCGAVGDAAIQVEGFDDPIGATSTVVGAALLHEWVRRCVELLIQAGHPPPVIRSANITGNDAHNALAFAAYRARIRHL